MEQLIEQRRFDNGVTVEFYDRSNRYFGDYHRVCIMVRCRVELTAELFAGEEDAAGTLGRARTALGPEVVSVRTLERMGVAGAEVPGAVQELVRGFLASAAAYLSHPGYPRQLVRRELDQRQRAPLKRFGKGSP